MFRTFRFVATLGLTLSLPIGAHAGNCDQLPNCAFANEYIRELGEMQLIIDHSQAELRGAKGQTEQFSDSIYSSRLVITTLGADIGMLKSLHGADQDSINLLIQLYAGQTGMHQRLIEIMTAFMGGPKPGVDYGALAAEVSQIRADLDSEGKLYLNMSNMIFMHLIDIANPDANNHVSRLTIDQESRQELINRINRTFGKRLEAKDMSYVCSGAWMLRANLQKPFTSSDAKLASRSP